MDVKELIQKAASQFSHSDSAKLDAQLLLGEVLEKSRIWLMTWDDAVVSTEDETRFMALARRRAKGEPIAYILGRREFWGLDLACNASTLIPRPETELLVEKALELDFPERAKVLDLGTGTGAIALALASEKPSWQITAVDFSAEAVALAECNRKKLALANVQISQSDWFSAIAPEQQFDLIVSNPPYVDPDSHYLDEGDVRFEPRSALVAENAGLADVEHLCSCGKNYLQSGGWLMLEHGFDQAEAVVRIFKNSGFNQVEVYLDLARHPRATIGQGYG